MLFHMSIGADDPQHVASVIAEIWGGRAMRFPPVSDNGWVALSGDERGTTIEVYPQGIVLREAEGDVDAVGELSGTDRFTPTHAAIATNLDQDAVLAIARRESWPAKYRKRGGLFGVVELWLEGHQMIEVLTPEMQAEYIAAHHAIAAGQPFPDRV
jgi:hypothetical protein